MEYEGFESHTHTTGPVKHTLDGEVCITENIRYYRYVPVTTYEIEIALMKMSDDEILELMNCITDITKGRVKFDMAYMIKATEWKKFEKEHGSSKCDPAEIEAVRKKIAKKIKDWEKKENKK